MEGYPIAIVIFDNASRAECPMVLYSAKCMGSLLSAAKALSKGMWYAIIGKDGSKLVEKHDRSRSIYIDRG
jgi:hypothetical protein